MNEEAIYKMRKTRKAKSLEEISCSILKSMTLERLSILYILNEKGMKDRKFFNRRKQHDDVIWLRNYLLVEPVKITKTLYYKYRITEKGKKTLAMFRRAFTYT